MAKQVMMTPQVFLTVRCWTKWTTSIGPNRSSIEFCHPGEGFSLTSGRGAMSWVMAVASRFLQVKHFVLMDFTTLELGGLGDPEEDSGPGDSLLNTAVPWETWKSLRIILVTGCL